MLSIFKALSSQSPLATESPKLGIDGKTMFNNQLFVMLCMSPAIEL